MRVILLICLLACVSAFGATTPTVTYSSPTSVTVTSTITNDVNLNSTNTIGVSGSVSLNSSNRVTVFGISSNAVLTAGTMISILDGDTNVPVQLTAVSTPVRYVMFIGMSNRLGNTGTVYVQQGDTNNGVAYPLATGTAYSWPIPANRSLDLTNFWFQHVTTNDCVGVLYAE